MTKLANLQLLKFRKIIWLCKLLIMRIVVQFCRFTAYFMFYKTRLFWFWEWLVVFIRLWPVPFIKPPFLRPSGWLTLPFLKELNCGWFPGWWTRLGTEDWRFLVTGDYGVVFVMLLMCVFWKLWTSDLKKSLPIDDELTAVLGVTHFCWFCLSNLFTILGMSFFRTESNLAVYIDLELWHKWFLFGLDISHSMLLEGLYNSGLSCNTLFSLKL